MLTVNAEDVNLICIEYLSGDQEATLYISNAEARELIEKLRVLVDHSAYTKKLAEV